MQTIGRLAACAASLAFIGVACAPGGDEDPPGLDPASGGSPAAGGSGGAAPSSGGNGSGGITVSLGGSNGSGGGNEGGACAAETSETRLKQVYLAVMFDVSGSMGKGDEEWHDESLKWVPVVEATKAFFTEPGSGVFASLTFFPVEGGEDPRCDPQSYVTPVVPMTELPSPAFGEAIDGAHELGVDDWIGGTPTLAVVQGTLAYITPLAAANADAVYAMVLITDGYPQDCEDDEIDSVVTEVSGALAANIPTYVIGVANPPVEDAPDTVTDLEAIAVAGGTEHAFIIETGNATQTSADLKAVIDGIRGQQLSCDVAIPEPPPGQEFDADMVNVTQVSGANRVEFAYSADCSAENSWHYDDPAAPTVISLCPGTCQLVQADPNAQLFVEFGCEQRIAVIR